MTFSLNLSVAIFLGRDARAAAGSPLCGLESGGARFYFVDQTIVRCCNSIMQAVMIKIRRAPPNAARWGLVRPR